MSQLLQSVNNSRIRHVYSVLDLAHAFYILLVGRRAGRHFDRVSINRLQGDFGDRSHRPGNRQACPQHRQVGSVMTYPGAHSAASRARPERAFRCQLSRRSLPYKLMAEYRDAEIDFADASLAPSLRCATTTAS